MLYSAQIAAQGAQTHGHAGGLRIVRRFWQAPRIEFLRGFDNSKYQAMHYKQLARTRAAHCALALDLKLSRQ